MAPGELPSDGSKEEIRAGDIFCEGPLSDPSVKTQISPDTCDHKRFFLFLAVGSGTDRETVVVIALPKNLYRIAFSTVPYYLCCFSNEEVA